MAPTTEFFTDVELDAVRKALTRVANDLHGLATKAHDYSKQRLQFRLRGIVDDMGVIDSRLAVKSTEMPCGRFEPRPIVTDMEALMEAHDRLCLHCDARHSAHNQEV